MPTSNKQVANSLILLGSMIATRKTRHLIVTTREQAVTVGAKG